jgi:hypothetical protein
MDARLVPEMEATNLGVATSTAFRSRDLFSRSEMDRSVPACSIDIGPSSALIGESNPFKSLGAFVKGIDDAMLAFRSNQALLAAEVADPSWQAVKDANELLRKSRSISKLEAHLSMVQKAQLALDGWGELADQLFPNRKAFLNAAGMAGWTGLNEGFFSDRELEQLFVRRLSFRFISAIYHFLSPEDRSAVLTLALIVLSLRNSRPHPVPTCETPFSPGYLRPGRCFAHAPPRSPAGDRSAALAV